MKEARISSRIDAELKKKEIQSYLKLVLNLPKQLQCFILKL